MYKYNKKQDEITDTSEKGKTGIPSVMKKSFEQSSGFSFDDVRVHYSSEKPAQLHAHAYTCLLYTSNAESMEFFINKNISHNI